MKSVMLNYRLDSDGVNPIKDTANEVYHSGDILLTSAYPVL